jgi:hypothetical protein
MCPGDFELLGLETILVAGREVCREAEARDKPGQAVRIQLQRPYKPK